MRVTVRKNSGFWTRFTLGEDGMVSILGVCALCVLMFLSATLCEVGMSRMRAARRFIVRDEVRNAAEDGVRLGLWTMNHDAGAASSAENATAYRVKIADGTSGDATFEVYARNKSGTILLLSVGEKGEEHSRAVGVLVKKAGKYVIEHWEY